MPAGADDNHIIVAFRLRLGPLLGPVLVGANGFANQGGEGKVDHGFYESTNSDLRNPWMYKRAVRSP